MSTSIETSALLLFEQTSAFLSTYMQDSVVTNINQNLSSVMDSCKQLFVFGTGPQSRMASNINPSSMAEIVVKYQSLNIPTSTRVSQMPSLYNSKIASSNDIQSKIETYTHLSSHYSKLIFGKEDTKFLTSDIIKLQFKQPVPTYQMMLDTINSCLNSESEYLKKHHTWTAGSADDPDWLQQMPHKQLFDAVSSNFNDGLDTHIKDEDAHSALFNKYLLKSDLDQIERQFTASIAVQQTRGQKEQAEISTRVQDVYHILSAELDHHKEATNQPNTWYSHKVIFDKYDRSEVVDAKDDQVRKQVADRFALHLRNGINEHPYLATKENPYLQGNIFLNCKDPNTKFSTNYDSTDNIPHYLFIKTSKNDFAKIGSYITASSPDCGGLLIQTGDNGNQPIKVQQTRGLDYTPVNTAYILDNNGNTSFPKKLSVKNLVVGDTSEFNGKITVYSSALLNQATINNRSTINIHNLPSGDHSWNIPTTQWVHFTISGLAKLFAVSGYLTQQNATYYPLVPNRPQNTNFVTQDFKYIRSIQFNPGEGRITTRAFKGTYGNFQDVYSKNVGAQTMNATASVTCPNFYGTADKAKTDTDGFGVNTRVYMYQQTNKDSYSFPILFTWPSSGNGKKTVGYYNNIHLNPAKGSITATYFKGHATTASWADLAQKYETDKKYPVGTLVQFGGEKQITVATTKINAVISDKPGFLMNEESNGQPIALVGRVPVRVIGKVNKFDYIGLSDIPGVGKVIGTEYTQNTIGIALQSSTEDTEKLILCCIQLHI